MRASSSRTSRTGKRARKPVLDASLAVDFDMTAAEAQSSISRPGPSILTVDSVSQDQRRVHRDSVPLPRSTGGTPSGTGTPQEGFSTLQSPDAGDPLATVDWDAFLLPLEPTAEDPLDDAAAKSKAPRYQNSVR